VGGMVESFGTATGKIAARDAQVGVEDGVAAEDVVCRWCW
jgi:hypothetical protein